jgi:FKBP-type peptidyl-prolyl cis-trans isomerase FkpA
MTGARALLLAGTIAGLAGGALPAAAEAVQLETDRQKTLYAVGLRLAETIAPYDLSPEELDLLLAGMRAGAGPDEPLLALDEWREAVDGFARTRTLDAQGALGRAYREKAAAEPGAITTDSGLVLIEIAPGEGASPTAEQTVRVHYHGTLTDGTVFDSSVDRGRPASFPLRRVIPCWTEALQKMKVGGKSRLVCPSEIAYGERGFPPKIPPGATLVFEVELLEIVR